MGVFRKISKNIITERGGNMSFGMVAASVIGAGAGFLGSKMMGDSGMEDVAMPEYYEDPDYREMQDILKALGPDILKGNIPEYYKPIGEFGGEEFEKYLGLAKGDVQQSVLESAAAAGRTGGVVQSAIAEETGALTTKSRYADWLRSLEGKQFLLNTGIGITESARGAGQAEEELRNRFNLDVTGLEMKKASALDDWNFNKSSMFSEGLGAAAGYASQVDFASILGKTNPAATLPGKVGGDDFSLSDLKLGNINPKGNTLYDKLLGGGF